MIVEREAPQRTVHVSGYLDLGRDELLGVLARPEAATVLQAALAAALGPVEDLTVETSPLHHVSAVNTNLAVSWHTPALTDGTGEGTATISFLTVRSGREPVTEVLVAAPAPDDAADRMAQVAHRLLDELTDRLALGAAGAASSV